MARIASLYLPWLGIVIENIGRLNYKKKTTNKVLKRPLNPSLSRYFRIIYVRYISFYNIVYFYHIAM